MSAKDLEQRGEGDGYILVDLDRTLAFYDSWEVNGEAIGEPVPAMAERVTRWIRAGRDVRIFTARASRTGTPGLVEREKIEAWCVEHLGKALPIQNWKDFHCIAIWDDLAISIEPNSGWRRTSDLGALDPLTELEEWELMGYDVEAFET